ncbi:MAG: hypothetical protein HY722_07930 [Planctomycetes bacterium]|nr:hypothetical protein [Planctomycetota bacterium]
MTPRAVQAVLHAALPTLLAIGGGQAWVRAEETRYFEAPELRGALEENVDRPVEFVDELVKIWKEQKVSGYVRFDTYHFRCAVPSTATASLEYLRDLEGSDAGKAPTPEPWLVHIAGKPVHPEFWGKVDADAAGSGVSPETTVIVVDEASRPRRRYFEDWRQGLRFQ